MHTVTLKELTTTFLLASIVFIRLMSAEDDFSFDYLAYINFFNALGEYEFFDLFGAQFLVFPYISIPKHSLFEVGFVLLSKLFISIFETSKATYAALAAVSVALRVYTMQKLGTHWFWIVLTNIYAITLFEANALRLGIASSLIIYGVYCLLKNKPMIAWLAIGLSILFHLQVIIFILPFAAAWTIRHRLENTRLSLSFFSVAMIVGALFFVTLIPQINNAKVEEYINRGSSNSAGLTISSAFGLVFTIVALCNRGRTASYKRSRLVWTSILAASLPSIILLMTLTSIAVIGDRAWQLSFVIISSVVFTGWAKRRTRRVTTILFTGLMLVSIVNITWRYPLSNFFDFILPHASIST
jgi:EpsG family